MRPIRHGNVPLRLLTGYLSQLSGCNLGEPELQRTVETHIQDLAALAIGANRDAREAGMRAVAAARLGAARAHIAACFDDAEMTVVSVARRLGVSPRYLQRLFEASGTSFTAHVTELRLQKAFAQLTDSLGRIRSDTRLLIPEQPDQFLPGGLQPCLTQHAGRLSTHLGVPIGQPGHD